LDREHALLLLHDPDGSREWVVEDEVLIGRDPDCAICVADRQVSRRHAAVRKAGAGYVVVDLGSKNGTWLNGVPVNGSARLADGDEISVAARAKLFFVDAEATAPIAFTGRGLRLDDATAEVFVNGLPLDPPVSGLQFQLLRILYDARGAIVTREEIVDRLWPDAASGVTEDAVDALVRRLRSRLAEIDPARSYVVTVRGHGFRLETDR
jgi:DNA-binding response OmpR family regulator